jgi:hypothetical protein
MTARFERAYKGSIPSSAANRSASRRGVAAHNGKQDGSKPSRATIYLRPRLSARTPVCGTGKHGAAPWVGTSFRSEAQVDERWSPKPEAPGRGLALRPFFRLAGAEKPFHLISCLEDMAIVCEHLLGLANSIEWRAVGGVLFGPCYDGGPAPKTNARCLLRICGGPNWRSLRTLRCESEICQLVRSPIGWICDK